MTDLAVCDWCDRLAACEHVAGELVCLDCIDGPGSTRTTVVVAEGQASILDPLPLELE